MARRNQHVISLEIPRGQLHKVLPQLIALIEKHGLRLVSHSTPSSVHVFHIEDAYIGSHMKPSTFGDNAVVVNGGSQVGIVAGAGATVQHAHVGQNAEPREASIDRREWEKDVAQILTALTDRLEELGTDYDKVKNYLLQGAAIGPADLAEHELLTRKLHAQFSQHPNQDVRNKALDFVKSLTGAIAQSATKALIEKAIGG